MVSSSRVRVESAETAETARSAVGSNTLLFLQLGSLTSSLRAHQFSEKAFSREGVRERQSEQSNEAVIASGPEVWRSTQLTQFTIRRLAFA